jgi:hypothetical protein
MANLYDIFRRVILANELEDNPALAYRFSDPDGTCSGKSGWSFGICQFDINNNPNAILCLRECGFTTDEIQGLKNQTICLDSLEAKLQAAHAIVDKWDQDQLMECLDHPSAMCEESGIVFDFDEAKIHLADYHNQFYMSRGGKMHRYLLALKHKITPLDVYTFKRKYTMWGKNHEADVNRRYHNIVRIYGGVA